MHLIKHTILGLLSMVMAGCVTYQPKPLNVATLTRALTAAPNKNQLIQQAACLHNPCLPPIQLDFSKPLTPPELAVITVLANPDLKALRTKEGVAQAQIFDAGLLPDPQAIISFDHPFPSQEYLFNAYFLNLNWDITSLITRHAKINGAKAQYQQTRLDIAWQEWSMANQAELLATRMYFLQQQINLAQEATVVAKHLLDLTYENVQKHDAKIDDFGLRQTTYLDFLDQMVTLERTLEKTRIELNQILGLPPTEKLALSIQPMSLPPDLNINDLFTQASMNRLDLFALQAGYASQEAKLYQAVLEQFPQISLGPSRMRDTAAVNTYGGVFNFTLPIFNANRGAIKIAHATREQLYQEYIARLYQTRTDIALLVSDLMLIDQEKKILIQQLPMMRKTVQLMKQGLDNGNITLITFEDVRAGLLNKEIRLSMLRQETAEQMISLQIDLGKCWP